MGFLERGLVKLCGLWSGFGSANPRHKTRDSIVLPKCTRQLRLEALSGKFGSEERPQARHIFGMKGNQVCVSLTSSAVPLLNSDAA